MTRTCEDEGEEEEQTGFGIWDCGSPLYDSHELASLSHVIERHMMVLPSLEGSKQIKTQFYDLEDSRSSKIHGGSSMVSRLIGFLLNLVWKRNRKKKEKQRNMRKRVL